MVQVNVTPITVRIKFYKVGGLQYISHLDLVRTMHKIIVRSSLPLWYTEGFNPKPKMVFAAPLSIGTESLCEYMDLRLTERLPESEIMDALNKNLTNEMQVVKVYYPETKLTDLKWLSYVITLNTIGASPELAEKVNEALRADAMPVAKKQKPEDAVDIKPLIRFASAVYDAGNIRIDCTLSADASSFLNPEYLVKYLRAACGVLSSGNLMAESYEILRHSAYAADMSEYR